eukprot:4268525-Pyramimonas_sp.AAC.1
MQSSCRGASLRRAWRGMHWSPWIQQDGPMTPQRAPRCRRGCTREPREAARAAATPPIHLDRPRAL